jgi:hypothetical protein
VVEWTPEGKLQGFINVDFVELDLLHGPNLYLLILATRKEEFKVKPVVQGKDIVFMVDRLLVRDQQRLTQVGLETTDLEKTLGHDQHQVLLKAQDIYIDFSHEDGRDTLGFVFLEVNDLQVFLFADRNDPLLLVVLVEDLLDVDDLLSMIAHPAVNVTHVFSRQEQDWTPAASHSQQF